MVVVDPQGRSGGLALLWREEEQGTLLSSSQHHIDIEVKVEGMAPWRLTGLYGEPDRAQRRKTWDLLRHLARDSNLPWCVIGDLNNVCSQLDKKGGALYPTWLIEGFNDTLNELGLMDMELVGHQFTWEKGRGTPEWQEVRLDRALSTDAWLQLFPIAKVYNLEGSESDHSPLLC
ncbi:Endonuclease/exonuclease/phosphatase family protein [Heracleum sosnowskyi]|uniref:Endonuclease/exonuclease/phosphatase family protein n=1 Tax=Heracleum sosnowskyi TaxID=360622 RepID=A0AAD8MG65_9APIA|nr:Endonuclease/exonuclease/phosphatase family protein [Heracleum sosnowskyi]